MSYSAYTLVGKEYDVLGVDTKNTSPHVLTTKIWACFSEDKSVSRRNHLKIEVEAHGTDRRDKFLHTDVRENGASLPPHLQYDFYV